MENMTMNKKLFAVKDEKVGNYFPPNPADNQVELSRALEDIINNNKDHNFYKHTSDFSLYQVGEFNQKTGEIIAMA